MTKTISIYCRDNCGPRNSALYNGRDDLIRYLCPFKCGMCSYIGEDRRHPDCGGPPRPPPPPPAPAPAQAPVPAPAQAPSPTSSSNSGKGKTIGHSGIAGPWAWTLDPENAGLLTDISIQKHKKIYHFGLVCLRSTDFGFCVFLDRYFRMPECQTIDTLALVGIQRFLLPVQIT